MDQLNVEVFDDGSAAIVENLRRLAIDSFLDETLTNRLADAESDAADFLVVEGIPYLHNVYIIALGLYKYVLNGCLIQLIRFTSHLFIP